jgi:hypothetical protein
LLPDSPAGRVKKRHAHKHASTAKNYSLLTTTQKKCFSSKSSSRTRKNWSKDPALSTAVKLYWSTRDQDKPPSQQDIARDFGIPQGTFGNYVNTNASKRRELGGQTGPKRMLSKENSEFLCQVAIHADRANKGLTPAQLQAHMHHLMPGMMAQQSMNQYYHSFLKDHKGRIKPKAVKAQSTSTRRSCCTVAQQFRWHNLVEERLNFLPKHNTGLCKRSGKTFGEVVDHFVVGYDEANMIANADGTVKIVGEFRRRKHEKIVSDCRASCTLGRSGSAAGSNGPTSFIMAGQHAASGFTRKMLLENGCCPGSGIYMTENAFLTDSCWLT